MVPLNYNLLQVCPHIVAGEIYNASPLCVYMDYVFLWHKTYMSLVIYHVPRLE